jgi:hypothetical protein
VHESTFGSFFADNANQVKTRDYLVSNLRAGYRHAGEYWEFSPFVGVVVLVQSF